MPLDGLRAWIGEVERKLGMRTRVFLVLATIAIGGAGAAIYLALETRDDAVSESDVRELQEQLEERIATGGATGPGGLTELEAELNSLEAEVEQLRGEGGPGDGDAKGSGGVGTGTDGTSNGTDAGVVAPDGASESATGGDGADGSSPDPLQQAKEGNERAEQEAEQGAQQTTPQKAGQGAPPKPQDAEQGAQQSP